MFAAEVDPVSTRVWLSEEPFKDAIGDGVCRESAGREVVEAAADPIRDATLAGESARAPETTLSLALRLRVRSWFTVNERVPRKLLRPRMYGSDFMCAPCE